MADLLTHLATGVVLGSPVRDGRQRAVFYFGLCFPDIMYKSFLYLTGSDNWFCESTHAPLGLVPLCYAVAMLFEEPWRKRAFVCLLAGSWVHLALDVGKDYLGSGVIPWAFPFSMDRIQLGWYYPEDTVYLMLPSLGIIAVWFIAKKILSALRKPRP